jgi:single-stranded-DNA-specific exonuclease
MATVADVVSLTGENRVIVKLGLEGFDQIHNAGLRALLEVSGIEAGCRPSATQVGFQLAPRINAAGRMDDASEVVRMFLTGDAAQALAIAKQLHELNQERQRTEREMVEQILAECERVPVTDADAALVFSATGWHRGVVGIVASRIVDRFCRPAFVLGEDAESGLAQGSARSVPGFHILEALESMPDLFSKFGGHKQAAGLTMNSARVAEFRRQRVGPGVPAFVFILNTAYVKGTCFSCADRLHELRFGRCWRCSLAWRLSCRLPIPAILADTLDSAKVCA